MLSPSTVDVARDRRSMVRAARAPGNPARGERHACLRALLWGCCAAWLLPSFTLGAEPAPYRQLVQSYQNLFQKPDSARQSTRPFIQAQVQYRGEGTTETTLRLDYSKLVIPADPASHLAEDQTVRVRTYNGNMIGPTIRVKPGDFLKIKIQNDLPAIEPNSDCMPHPPYDDTPHGWNCTNLHTHGLHVSPEGNSDNVFKEIAPCSPPFTYEYRIPADHVAGTFWYHPHKHGSVALQVTTGLAGALIVQGGLDDVPEIRAAFERIMVFQQLTFRPDPKNVVSPLPGDIYRRLPAGQPAPLTGAAKPIVVTLINGQLHPVIEVAPGSVERWRFIHAGIEGPINVAVVKDDAQLSDPAHATRVPLHEIAVDGIPRGKRLERPNYIMYPGYRWDVLFKAPDKPGTYFLTSDQTASNQQILDRPSPGREFLAKVVVAGRQHPMRLPHDHELEACVPSQFAHITKEETTGSDGKQRVCALELKANFGANPTYWIDKCEYKEKRLDRVARLNQAEEWHLTGNGHPFHIHVNPFEQLVFDKNNQLVDCIWRDTLYIGSLTTPTIVRMRFRDFTGRTVLHCHILDHEDQGMMENFEILCENEPLGNRQVRVKCDRQVVQQCVEGAAPPAGKEVGTVAPEFDLPGTDGRRHRLSEFADRKVVLVFFRGLGCLHCVEQLQSLRELEPRFRAQNVSLVAVSSDSADALAAAYRSYTRKQSLPILLLADSDLKAFRAFGCVSGEPQHGTFVLDRRRRIVWQNVAPQPFMDLEGVLKQCQEVRSRSNQLTKNNW